MMYTPEGMSFQGQGVVRGKSSLALYQIEGRFQGLGSPCA
jgi:hypothetical protein